MLPLIKVENTLFFMKGYPIQIDTVSMEKLSVYFKGIAPDKAAYCVFTQFRGPENAI